MADFIERLEKLKNQNQQAGTGNPASASANLYTQAVQPKEQGLYTQATQPKNFVERVQDLQQQNLYTQATQAARTGNGPSARSTSSHGSARAAGQYAGVTQNTDYAEKSQAGESKLKWFGGDQKYDYINNINGFRTQLDAQMRSGQYSKYSYMNDRERQLYNYLYATGGKSAAEDYLKQLEPHLNRQEYEATLKGATEAAMEHPMIAGGLTTAAQPIRTMSSMAALGQDWLRTTFRQGIDPYSPLRQISRLSSDVRQNVAQEAAENPDRWTWSSIVAQVGEDTNRMLASDAAVKWAMENQRENPALNPFLDKGEIDNKARGEIASFVYQTALSAADSAVNGEVARMLAMAGAPVSTDALMDATNTIGAALMSSEVASLGVAEAKEKGYSDAGALVLGLIRGGVEYASEAIGGDWVIANVKKNPLNFVQSMVLNMIPESVEEVMSDVMNGIINLGIDAIFGTQESGIPKLMQEFSTTGWEKNHPKIAKIMDKMGTKDPRVAVVLSLLGDELLSALGGALATVGSSGVQTYNIRTGIDTTSKELGITRENVAKLMNEYNATPEEVADMAKVLEAKTAEEIRKKAGTGQTAKEIIEAAYQKKYTEALTNRYLDRKISAMGVDEATRKALKDNYAGGNVSVQDYARGVQEALRMGRNGASLTQTVGALRQLGLSGEQILPAWQAGAQKAEKTAAEVEKAAEKFRQLRMQTDGEQTQTRTGGLTVAAQDGVVPNTDLRYSAVDMSRLNDTQRATLDAVQSMAQILGLDVTAVSAKGDFGGAYYQGGKIYLNIDSGMNLEGYSKAIAAGSFAHELTHWLKQYAPEEFRALQKIVTESMSTEQLDSLVREQMRSQPGLSYDEAMEEVIANACQPLLQDSRAFEQLARQNMTLAEKILDFLKEFVSRLKDAFAEIDYRDNIPIYNAVRAAEGSLAEMQKAFDSAIVAAKENMEAETAVRAQQTQESAGAEQAETVNGESRLEGADPRVSGDAEKLRAVLAATSNANNEMYDADVKTLDLEGYQKVLAQQTGPKLQEWENPARSEEKINRIREQISDIDSQLDFAIGREATQLENQRVKQQAQLDKLTAAERKAAKKTALSTIMDNMDLYRRSDLESLAEQISDGAWDDYESLSDSELRDALREEIQTRMDDMTPLEQQAPKYGLYVRQPSQQTGPRPMLQAWQINTQYDYGVDQYEINQYVDDAYTKSNKAEYRKWAAAEPRLISDVHDEIPDIDEYSHALRDNDIRHARNSHGENTNEKYPVTKEDQKLIPYIVKNYDKVVVKYQNGKPGLVYVKVMDDNLVYYLESVTTEYHGEKLLVNKQMIKTGLNDIPGLNGLREAIEKKQAIAGFLADLDQIHKAYARSAYQDNTVSTETIPQAEENSKPQMQTWSQEDADARDELVEEISRHEPIDIMPDDTEDAVATPTHWSAALWGPTDQQQETTQKDSHDITPGKWDREPATRDWTADMFGPAEQEQETRAVETAAKEGNAALAEYTKDLPKDPVDLYKDREKVTSKVGIEKMQARKKGENKTLKDRISDAWHQFVRSIVNEGDAIHQAGLRTGNKALDGMYFYAKAATQRAQQWITERRMSADYSKSGKSLNEVLDPIRDKGDEYYKNFQLYMYHMLNIDRWSRSRAKDLQDAQGMVDDIAAQAPELATMSKERLKNLARQYEEAGGLGYEEGGYGELAQQYLDALAARDRAERKQVKPVFGWDTGADVSQKVVRDLLAEHPEFEELARNVYDYCDDLLQYRVDSGLITQEDAKRLKDTYAHYIPVYYDVEGPGAAKVHDGNIDVSTTIKKAKGGDHAIMPLHYALTRQTLSVMRNAGYEQLASEIYNEYDKNPVAMGRYVKDVEEEPHVWDEDMADNDDSTEPYENAVSFLRDGKRYTMTLEGDMSYAFQSIKSNLGKGDIKVMRAANDWFKKLCTSYNLLFMITNPVRDIQDALFYSTDTKRWLTNYPKAVSQIAGNGKYWQMYKGMGAVAGSYFDWATAENGKKMGKVEALNMAIEQAPRLAEFMTVLENAERNHGSATQSDRMEAFNAAQEVTTNFGRGGTMGKWINRNIVPFWNPGVQGLSKFVRTATETRSFKAWAGLAIKAAGLGILPELLNGWLYRDDDEWDKIDDQMKMEYYLFKGKDGVWIKIPKGRVLAALSMPAVGVQEALRGDNVDWGDLVKQAFGSIAPNNPIQSNLFSAALQADLLNPDSTGKTWYGGNIESRRLQSYAPGERYDESTDAISKWIGGKLNVSPKKLSYILDQYSGVIGDVILPYLTPKAERGWYPEALGGNIAVPFSNAFMSRFTTDTVTSNTISDEYYDLMDELGYGAKRGDEASAMAERYMSRANSRVSEIYAEIRKIENDTELTDREKTTLTRELKKELNTYEQDVTAQATEYFTAAQSYLANNPELDYTDDDRVDAWMDAYNSAQTEEKYQITADQAENKMKNEAYREINREVYGSEYALEVYDKDVYAKARTLNEESGLSYDDYYDYYFGTRQLYADKDEDGKSISGSKKEKVVDYIANMDIPDEQKDALYIAAGYAEKSLGTTPWHNGSGKYTTSGGRRGSGRRKAAAKPKAVGGTQKASAPGIDISELFGGTRSGTKKAAGSDLTEELGKIINRYYGGDIIAAAVDGGRRARAKSKVDFEL